MVDWNPKVLNESQTCPIVGHQSASICVPVIVIPFAQIGLPQPNAVLILLSLVQWPRRWNIISTATGPWSRVSAPIVERFPLCPKLQSRKPKHIFRG